MASLRDIRNRIRTVASTAKITKAMKMVAAARFRRAQERVTAARPYAQEVNALMQRLCQDAEEPRHPLLQKREGQRRALVILTSDRGLCGAFNANLLRLAREEIQTNPPVLVMPLGKKGTAHFTKHYGKNLQVVDGYWDGFNYDKARGLMQGLAKSFLQGEIDRVDVLYNEFHSVISQKPTRVTILPFATSSPEADASQTEILFEPSEEKIVEALVPRAMEVRFYLTCLNSLASEYGARMTAMDAASRNAEEMISDLTLKMNRARQASITTELMEIIGGAEALNEG